MNFCDKQQIIQELEAITTLRENRNRVANLVLKSASNFLPLLEIVFNTDKKISFRAAWVLEYVVHKKPNWLLKHINYFTNNISKIKNGSAIRSVAKVYEIFSLHLDKNPLEKEKYKNNINQIIETGFDWMLSEHKIAIKVYTMQTLFLFGKDQSWIHQELKIILENNLHKETVGYRNRALKILEKINTLK